MDIAESIARHAAIDIKDFQTSKRRAVVPILLSMKGGVINAAAYRAFLLTSASQVFSNEDYWKIAERNLNFVLENQNPDGSWFYAVDGVRDFVDHYHTCFVMKALAKIHALTGHAATLEALGKGVSYYLNNLFDADGLPKPFSRAPRLTVYKRELYDCAECINLCLLLRDRFPRWKQHWKQCRGNSERLDQTRRFVPFPRITSGLGQCPDASLGTVADVSKPCVLLAESFERRNENQDAKQQDGRTRKVMPATLEPLFSPVSLRSSVLP